MTLSAAVAKGGFKPCKQRFFAVESVVIVSAEVHDERLPCDHSSSGSSSSSSSKRTVDESSHSLN